MSESDNTTPFNGAVLPSTWNQSDSRPSTPTPVIPRRPLSSCSQHRNSIWDNRTSMLLEVDVLEDLNNNLNNGSASGSSPNDSPQDTNDRHHLQFNRLSSFFDDGVQINERTGSPIPVDYDGKVEIPESPEIEQGNPHTPPNSSPRSSQVLQDPIQARPHPRQERMLKRSSQLQLLNYNNNNRYKGGKAKSRNSSQDALAVIDGKLAAKRMSNGVDISENEKSMLADLFKKKKAHDQMVRNRSNSGSGSEDELNNVYMYGDNESRRWLNRPSGPIPLGPMAGLIFALMLLYNGLLGTIVYKASRFPQDTNMSIYLLSIVFIFTAILSPFGVGAAFALVRSSNNSNPYSLAGRVPRILYRTFHILYLLTSFITFVGMLAWLRLNKVQTGSWDRMFLPPPPTGSGTESSFGLRFESMLDQDPTDPNLWILNPGLWIVAFLVIWIFQLYSWVCLAAFGRRSARIQMLRWRKVEELKKQFEVMQYSY
ncbi:MAG: hypothetical protein J3Q66DRAFT_353201 [Benniella sp.]|nr:MAG: hypothetical protein J3Q66DRAFT_353201 [Benniella sp.]